MDTLYSGLIMTAMFARQSLNKSWAVNILLTANDFCRSGAVLETTTAFLARKPRVRSHVVQCDCAIALKSETKQDPFSTIWIRFAKRLIASSADMFTTWNNLRKVFLKPLEESWRLGRKNGVNNIEDMIQPGSTTTRSERNILMTSLKTNFSRNSKWLSKKSSIFSQSRK